MSHVASRPTAPGRPELPYCARVPRRLPARALGARALRRSREPPRRRSRPGRHRARRAPDRGRGVSRARSRRGAGRARSARLGARASGSRASPRAPRAWSGSTASCSASRASRRASEYYDPRNSYLNEVLARRCGIPITLALVYIAVARRAGIDARGVAFPGHFLVRCPAERRRAHRRRVPRPHDLVRRVRGAARQRARPRRRAAPRAAPARRERARDARAHAREPAAHLRGQRRRGAAARVLRPDRAAHARATRSRCATARSSTSGSAGSRAAIADLEAALQHAPDAELASALARRATRCARGSAARIDASV